MTFNDRLLLALDEARLQRADLARHLGVSQAALSQLVKGRTRAMNAENTARAAAFLRVECLWLATGQGPMRSSAFSPMAADLARQFDLIPLDERDRLHAFLSYSLRLARLATANQPLSEPEAPAPSDEPTARR